MRTISKTLIGYLFKEFLNRVPIKFKIILMYHRVTHEMPDELHDPHMYVTSRTLGMHLNELKRYFTIVTLEELVFHNQKSPGSCSITFDDGWKDNYEVALPILTQYNASATVFLPVADIGTNNWFWFEHIFYLANKVIKSQSLQHEFIRFFNGAVPNWNEYEICTISLLRLNEKLKFLSAERILNVVDRAYVALNCDKPSESIVLDWHQVEKMGRNDIFFGSHGMNHDIIPLLDKASKLQAIAGSSRVLQEKKDINFTPFFSYPNGDCDNEIISMLEKYGYRGAATTVSGRVSSQARFRLKRVGLCESSSNTANLLWFQIAKAFVSLPCTERESYIPLFYSFG